MFSAIWSHSKKKRRRTLRKEYCYYHCSILSIYMLPSFFSLLKAYICILGRSRRLYILRQDVGAKLTHTHNRQGEKSRHECLSQNVERLRESKSDIVQIRPQYKTEGNFTCMFFFSRLVLKRQQITLLLLPARKEILNLLNFYV